MRRQKSIHYGRTSVKENQMEGGVVYKSAVDDFRLLTGMIDSYWTSVNFYTGRIDGESTVDIDFFAHCGCGTRVYEEGDDPLSVAGHFGKGEPIVKPTL